MEKSSFALRLIKLRNDNHLTQPQFAQKLSKYIDREKTFSTATISQWELGYKMPNFDVLLAIADIFDVSTDFLLGRRNGTLGATEAKPFYMDDFTTEITQSDIIKYHEKPVYVISKDGETCKWGIYDDDKKCIICIDRNITLDYSKMKLYAAPPEKLPVYRASEQRLEMEDFLKTKHIWVEYLSPDESIRSKYSGWYKHAAGDCIINSNGCVLPYSGLDYAYYAYRNPV